MHAHEPRDTKSAPRTARWVPLLLIAGPLLGCAAQSPPDAASTPPTAAPVEILSDELAVRLVAILDQAAPGTLVDAPGWQDYRIDITNLADQPTVIRTVKLRDSSGRYVPAANDVAELSAPPDLATRVAGDVALRGVGIAAGQAIPYGGSIVGLLTSAARANAQQERAQRRRRFMLSNLREVELAPGAQFTGNAYLPAVQSPAALVIEWRQLDGETHRIELPLTDASAVAGGPAAERP
jgi:hypothetical protein